MAHCQDRGGDERLVPDLGEHRHGEGLGESLQNGAHLRGAPERRATGRSGGGRRRRNAGLVVVVAAAGGGEASRHCMSRSEFAEAAVEAEQPAEI